MDADLTCSLQFSYAVQIRINFSTKLFKSGESRSVTIKLHCSSASIKVTTRKYNSPSVFLSGAKRRNSVLRLSIEPWRRRPYDVSFNVYIERFSLRYAASRVYLENDNSGPLPTG